VITRDHDADTCRNRIVVRLPAADTDDLNVSVHFTRVSDLVGRDNLAVDPPVPMAAYRDSFGNWCTRIVASGGRTRVSASAVANDRGAPDPVVPYAKQVRVPQHDLCIDAASAR